MRDFEFRFVLFRKKEEKDLETIVAETNRHLADLDAGVKLLRSEVKFLRDVIRKAEEKAIEQTDELESVKRRLTKLEAELKDLKRSLESFVPILEDLKVLRR